MPDLDLDELQALCDAVGALKGKWVAVSVDGFAYVLVEADEFGRWDARDALATIDNLGAEALHYDVARMLAAARTALPALIARVRRAEEKVARVEAIESRLHQESVRCRVLKQNNRAGTVRAQLDRIQEAYDAVATEIRRALSDPTPTGGAADAR